MSKPGNYLLFVYGSLLSGFRSPAYEYITRYFDLVSGGRVEGLLYDMGEYPAAIPAPGSGHLIEGELLRIRNQQEFSWAMAQLDDYEGVLVEAGETRLYRRELAEIQVAGGTETAWIYWFNGDVSDRPQIESGNLLEYRSGRKP
ncbi:MAG: gamma-glutamylcyclotransferase [Chitinophagaceae bacterium]|nr:MAG: gamma-glutamylcyclotransferase [Chitinophagaceae bacterium]